MSEGAGPNLPVCLPVRPPVCLLVYLLYSSNHDLITHNFSYLAASIKEKEDILHYTPVPLLISVPLLTRITGHGESSAFLSVL